MIATTRVKWLALAVAGLPYPFMLVTKGQNETRVLYARDVQPILKAHCVSCHDGKTAAGGLRLDSPEGLLKAVRKGDAAHSELIRRIKGLDGKPAMPMGFPALPKEKVATLEAWIAQGAATTAPKALFARDVQPIFKAHCATCHGGQTPAGGLDLTDPKAALRVVVKGDPMGSTLMRRILGLDGKPRMPKGFVPLNDRQIAAIKDWIAEGAFLDGGETRHWAYVAPTLPAVPAIKSAWIRNPVDAFVLARLKREGLRPSPEADRSTLLRRLSLDLIGLPPTPKEVAAFLADRSPKAYEKVVDRLLASPHYGERMAQRWMDLARYADSDGYEKDLNRSAWKYRDWTIAAFNQNMSYDRFVVEQIGGDQLPNATLDQRIATGFSRNSMLNREGGVDPEEAYFNVILDRVGTTSSVFMGSTLACARCHDHKYDPFSQKDFYQMAAFFSNDVMTVRGDVSVSEGKAEEPVLAVPTPAQSARIRAIQAQIDALPKASAVPRAPATWTLAHPTSASAERAKVAVESDGTVVAAGENAAKESYRVALDPLTGPMTGLRLETLAGRNPDNLNFVVTGVRVLADGKPVALLGSSADFSQRMFDGANALTGDADNGWAVDPKGREPHALVVSFASPVTAKSLEVEVACRSKYSGHNLGRFRLSLTGSPEPHAEHGKALSEIRRAALMAEKASVERTAPTALVLQEKPGNAVPKAWLRTRGEFLSKAEEVTAATPHFLPPLPKGARPSRLALGRWLVSKDNPLTARVEANRLWEGLFGAGLVETSEDFGTQGTPPSHPELLDWLAVRLRDGVPGVRPWDVKALVRTIVTSATYRQSSVATPALLKRDPNDRLLARYPRVRLEAETIRDNALAVAGLLSRKIGGPSVMPDQPEGVWDTPYNGERWTRSEGEDRWRRGLYTVWKRSAPYPAFVAFDATSREVCTVRRVRTNTPLQALALLNDSGMIAAAQAMGQRMVREGGGDPIGYGFLLATGRRPSAAEAKRLAALRSRLLVRYRSKPQEAAKLGGPEKAALTLTANVLLNLDETITKE